jgi:oxaloacetate decarboxylase alpha subunit/pyruvate carboxylase subunit B
LFSFALNFFYTRKTNKYKKEMYFCGTNLSVMPHTLLIRDLTLRDGQQSAFATRMTQSQIDRVLPFYKAAGFYAMEVWGGAVPDSIMRYLGENPWDRLEKIHAAVGNVSKLTALSRGRNLFGYAPYPDNIIEGFCKNAIESGLGIMRIFDALNDIDNVKSTIKYVKQYGGIADCAVCYTIDPHFPFSERLKAFFKGKPLPKKVFTNDYFLQKALAMEALGADMISIKDMSGLIEPSHVAEMITLFKKHLKIPVDFHTHCTPGYGLAAVLSAIISGVDIVDAVIWNFSGGPAAPAVELIYVFCKKLGIDFDVDMEAVAKINAELLNIRKELDKFDAVKQFPNPFNPLTDTLPAEIDREFDNAIAAAKIGNEEALLKACHAIEAYFNFPAPNELVKNAEIPGGMYTNMVAQLKELGSMDIIEDAMKLIPTVRLAAGLPPLVTPTSQIVGAQAVNCATSLKNGKAMYSNISNQFVALVKGEYGKTPVPIDADFREKITGSREEIPYDTSKHKMQANPLLPQFDNVPLAENEKEILLLELFPAVAAGFLTKEKGKRYLAEHPPVPVEPTEEELLAERLFAALG